MKQHMMIEVYDVNNIIWPMPTSTFSDSVISLSHSRLETRTEVKGAPPASAKPHLSSYKHATAAVLVRPCLEAAPHTFREHRSVCMCVKINSSSRPNPSVQRHEAFTFTLSLLCCCFHKDTLTASENRLDGYTIVTCTCLCVFVSVCDIMKGCP